MAENKIGSNWDILFEKYCIIDEIKNTGKFTINSQQIKEVMEARLMAKIDHSFQLPRVFAENNLSILPITRGEYIISDINTFFDFNISNIPIKEVEFPEYIESLDFKNITSEAIAINAAYISGILDDFIEDTYLVPAINGRMSSQQFDFNIQRNTLNKELLNINVTKSQIEIDAGYEGLNSLNLIEAKNTISKDFIIRQLYYPYRLWQSKLTKIVRPIFLTYTNGIFHLREYAFENLYNYNSIVLSKEKKYRIKEKVLLTINIEKIHELIMNIEIVNEPENIPFPQADSFERIINLCEILSQKTNITKEELISEYDFKQRDTFDMRQVDYYTNAAIYLGFVEKIKNEREDIAFKLSNKGNELFNYSIKERQLEFAKSIISHLVFKKTLLLYLDKYAAPSLDEIVNIMKESNLHNVNSNSTYKRRASTITSWNNWILDLIEE